MSYIKLDVNNVVVYKTPYAEAGTIEAPDSVVCGMIKIGAEYTSPTPSLAQARAAMWEKIKARRTVVKHGGVLASGKWFHTDEESRTQQLGLVIMGVSVPPAQWKTMDGTFISMTQTLASAIFNAVAASDQASFANAESHRLAMEASATPNTYNFSTGWPASYP